VFSKIKSQNLKQNLFFSFQIKMYIISSSLISEFVKISGKNVDGNGQHIETLAFLLGSYENDNYIATTLVFPEQNGESHKVEDQGRKLLMDDMRQYNLLLKFFCIFQVYKVKIH